MTVIETRLATEPPGGPSPSRALVGVLWVLKLIVPLSNPDFEDLYSNVRKWWVEIDSTGTPQRELGFDADGKIIVAGPFGKNFGYWTDSSMVFEADKEKPVAVGEFESAWALFKASHLSIADEDD